MNQAEILRGMNPQQLEPIQTLEGALLLLAGAGTGKTTVIVRRIANLLLHGTAPESILAVTFTNKAAREMKERLRKMTGEENASRMTIGTFHAFCARVLHEHAVRLGFSRNFSLATTSYQQGLVKELMTAAGQVGEGYDADAWLHQISISKSRLESPDELAEREGFRMAEKAEIYAAYQKRLQQMDLMDFDDLLCLTVKLWSENPRVLESYRARYKQLLIDEYQDTNLVQLKIMLMLAGEHGNITVVGDDDQSIYGWRGASLSNITEFESYFPKAKVIRLEQNYRSTGNILTAANSLIAHNKVRREKNLWSEHGQGDPLKVVECDDADKEAEFIANYALDRHLTQGWGGLAVLFRSNFQARSLEQGLRKKRVPYVLVGANSFYQNKEILDAISFLYCLVNPKADLHFLRILNVPPRGIGDTTVTILRDFRESCHLPLQEIASDKDVLDKLPAAAASALSSLLQIFDKYRREFSTPSDLAGKCRRYFEALDYLNGLGRMYKPREDALRRRDNVLEFFNALADFEQDSHNPSTLEAFLENMALQDANDRFSKDKKVQENDAVTLMTIHASKGLEFPDVIIAGVEKDLLPNQRAVEEGSLEEERRLFYVAITRAQERLALTYADKRMVRGNLHRKIASEFLDELPQDIVKYLKPSQFFAKLSPEEVTKQMQEKLRAFLQKDKQG